MGANQPSTPVAISRYRPLAVVLIVIGTSLSAAYPFLVFWGGWLVSPVWLVVSLAAVIVARSLFVKGKLFAATSTSMLLIPAVCVYAAWVLSSNDDRAVLYYPVIVNLTVLWLFGHTLVRPPSLIERIARARGMAVSAEGVGYLRTLTKIWCVLSAINAIAAFVTATYMNAYAWWLYNGVIAYALMTVLFVGEMLYRPYYKRRVHQHSSKTYNR